MEVYILDKNYDRIGHIDISESIIWIKRYNDVGECEIYVPCEQNMLSILQKGNYVYREDDDMLCKIESIQIETSIENGDYIIATGKDVVGILSDRIVISEVTFNGLVFDFIKKLIQDNVINPAMNERKVGNLEFYVDNRNEFTETITIRSFSEDLLELIKTTCKTYNYGFKIKYIHNTRTLQFHLYKGKDKASITSDAYIEFSPTLSNIISSDYKDDDSNYKNVCIVGYKDVDENIKLLNVFFGDTEPIGEERREIYVDGTSINREISVDELQTLFPIGLKHISVTWSIELGGGLTTVAIDSDDGKVNITDYTYSLLIESLGYNTLTERAKTQIFSGEVDTIDTYEYKNDYDLGDIVKVINEYGIGAEARITEITESDDNDDGYVVEPKFEYIN